MILDYFKALFIPKEKELTREECVLVLRSAGYKQRDDYSFKYRNGSGSYDISIYEDRVKVRMCTGEFTDTEVKLLPVTKIQLKRFVNQSIY